MEAEREFITRIINTPDLASETPLKPVDLVTPAYRAAFSAVLKLIREGASPDLPTVVSECQEHIGLLSSIDTMSRANFGYWHKLVISQVEARRLQFANQELSDLLNSGTSAREAMRIHEERLSECRVQHEAHKIKTVHECVQDFLPILKERFDNKGKIVGIPTGFSLLDSMTGGFQPGTYYIGARPSEGKTALLLKFMRESMRAGEPAGLISNESSDMELISRVLAAEGPVRASSLKSGMLSPNEFAKLTNAMNRLEHSKSHIYFNTKIDVAELENVARRMVKTLGCKILFIDYLQRIYAPGGTKWEQVSNASRAITDIAKGLGVPVVCLAQTGRDADKEAPSMGHYQHSSAIEQDADVGILIWHKKDEDEREESFLVVAKNRDGEVGNIPVFFDRQHVRFVERAHGTD